MSKINPQRKFKAVNEVI